METRPGLLITDDVPTQLAAQLADAFAEFVPADRLHYATLPDETRELLTEIEAIVTTRLAVESLERATKLRWVHALSSGVDGYPLDAFDDRGIALTNSAGVHAEPIAEHVLCFMLMFERGLHTSVRQQARGVWERIEGGELRGKTIGIIGVGAIGTRLAQVASGLGMTVIGTKRDLDVVPDAVDEIYAASALNEVLHRSHYVALTCPLTEETRGLIGSTELGVMRRDGVLVNVGRGELVDEAALTVALQQKRINAAGLDVFRAEPLPRDSPLWDLSNVVITPHMAGSTPHKIDRWLELIRPNYEAVAADRFGDLRNRVV